MLLMVPSNANGMVNTMYQTTCAPGIKHPITIVCGTRKPIVTILVEYFIALLVNDVIASKVKIAIEWRVCVSKM